MDLCVSDVCLAVCLAGWLIGPPSCMARTLMLDIMLSKLSTQVFIPAMLDMIYHFMPLPLTLTVAVGHKFSQKQDLLASFSWSLFISSG